MRRLSRPTEVIEDAAKTSSNADAGELMSRYGRIERGYMAADHFTQVSNELARDKRLSRKARGLFLEIVSHRDGYGLTVESLVRSGPEGRDAVMTGLQELERYGYLQRHQERDERGRLGQAVYRITDTPKRPTRPDDAEARQTSRSQPMSENPATANPTPGEPTSDRPKPKKNKIKKTKRQNTNPSPPSTAESNARSHAPRKQRQTSPGVSLLLEIGTRDPRLGIGGDALAREGERLDALLAAGWNADTLHTALTAGLPAQITNPAGFLARRISHIPVAPAPPLPAQAIGPVRTETSTPPPFGQHLPTPPLPECDDCGVPPVPGHDRCAACMGWPSCSACERRHAPPEGSGLCKVCDEEHHAWQTAEAALNATLGEPR